MCSSDLRTRALRRLSRGRDSRRSLAFFYPRKQCLLLTCRHRSRASGTVADAWSKEQTDEFVGLGGAAHLPGMAASQTSLPVLGVPVQSKMLSGIDSLLSIAQMPAGVPVGTLAIGPAGATNAALLAASILANKYPAIAAALDAYRAAQTAAVLERPDPSGT